MDSSRLQDTPAVVLLRLLADLMVANILALICSFPVFTLGASLSAMYSVMFTRERNDGAVSVIKTFFRSFVTGFGQSTILGLIVTLMGVVAFGDIWFGVHSQPPLRGMFVVVGTIVALAALVLFVLAFAQQSAYTNSVKKYLQNSFALMLCAPVQLILSLAAWILPWVAMAAYPEVFLMRFGFVYLMWGFSFPAWITARLFNKVFEKAGKPAEEKENTDRS